MECPQPDRDVTAALLTELGYDPEFARRIEALLADGQQLDWYLRKGARQDCYPISRAGSSYPGRLRRLLGEDAPGCLWAKGDMSLLERPAIALVGSRDMEPENLAFAKEAGRQAALQGYVLVSGNARGADREAQTACLDMGGCVISVVADRLEAHPLQRNVLYLSEDSFDMAFSAQRALSRNRVIHCMGDTVLVAQCGFRRGGTWDGTAQNLRWGWCPVCCYDDGSQAVDALTQMGAVRIRPEALTALDRLNINTERLF